jgi:hypothetical protein
MTDVDQRELTMAAIKRYKHALGVDIALNRQGQLDPFDIYAQAKVAIVELAVLRDMVFGLGASTEDGDVDPEMRAELERSLHEKLRASLERQIAKLDGPRIVMPNTQQAQPS